MTTINRDEWGWRDYAVPGDGGISVELRPLDLGGYLRLLALLQTEDGGPVDAAAGMARARRMIAHPDLAAAAADVIPRHVRNIRGITVSADGGDSAPLAPADLVTYGAPLFHVLLPILIQLFVISQLSPEDRGK